MLLPIHVSPTLFRAFLTALVLLVLAVALVTFYYFAGSPTDENLFTTSPGNLLITRTIPGQPVPRELRTGYKFSRIADKPDLQPGDILIGIDTLFFRSLADYSAELRKRSNDSVVTLVAFRPGTRLSLAFRVRRTALDADHVREIGPSVHITDVTPGGASDRAGLKIGDVIVRINRESFATANEADRIMRRGKLGVGTQYDILRDGQPLTVQVVLARFGFSVAVLMFCLAGYVYMGIGAFIGLKRPGEPAARLLALWFVLLGFMIAVIAIRREVETTWLTTARELMIVWAGGLGMVAGVHAHWKFPCEREIPRWGKIILVVLYAAAAVAPFLTLLFTKLIGATAAVPVFIILGLMIMISWLIQGIRCPSCPGELRKATWILRGAVLVTAAGTIALPVVFSILFRGVQVIGIMGACLTVIPLTYLFVMGHYRLLGLDLRIRRNVQYSVISILWGALVLLLLLQAFRILPGVTVPLPGVSITSGSVEITEAAANEEERVFLERLLFMVGGTIVWYVLWRLRKGGQHAIDTMYDRGTFDYRRAAREMGEVLATKVGVADLSRGFVEMLVDLLRLKRGGVLVIRENLRVHDVATGVGPDEWQAVREAVPELLSAAGSDAPSNLLSRSLDQAVRKAVDEAGLSYVHPIRSKTRIVGFLLLGEKLAETALTQEDRTFIETVARQLAVSVENAFLYEEVAEKDRMEHELEIARNIQLSSLPSDVPAVANLDIAGVSIPALEVGGDFYDYLDARADRVTIVVGDVSGKGTSAALYMSKIQGILHSLEDFDLALPELFARLNRILGPDLSRAAFVTAIGVRILGSDHKAAVVRAGHLPLYHYRRADGVVTALIPKGMGIGLDDDHLFEEELELLSLTFAPGDALCCVTDGITEARNAGGEEFGEERLRASIARLSATGSHAQELRDRLLTDLAAFTAGAFQHDDQTVVVVRTL